MRIIHNMPAGRRRAFAVSAIVGGSLAIATAAFAAIIALTATLSGSVTPSAAPTFSVLTQDTAPVAAGSGDAVCPPITADASTGAVNLGAVTGFAGDTCTYTLKVKPSTGGFVGLSSSTPVTVPVTGTNATLISSAQLAVVGGNNRCVITFTLTIPTTAVSALNVQLKPSVDTKGGYATCPV